MKGFKRLKGLLRSDRGNVLMIAAGAMPLLMASAGFAIDTIYLSSMKRQMQRAADSSALAGAYALSQEMSAETAVSRDLTKNKYPTLAQAQQVTVGASHGFQRTVRVQLRTTPRLPFMTMFTKAPTLITSDATAAIVEGGEFCVLSLYDGSDPGIDVGGTARLNLGCGMAANSRGTEAVTAFGNSLVNASPVMAVGGLNGDTSNFAGPVRLQPYAAEQQDPFANLANPTLPADCSGKIQVQPNDDPSVPLQPGCYSSIDIKGTATLAPGTYYVNGGDIEFGSQANVTGNGVTFVMTGPGGAAGDLKIDGNPTLNLKAPSGGDYDGILFYRDRRASNIEIKINGSSTSTMVGAFYFPSSDITFTGDAGLQVRCFQMVGRILRFRGTAEINNTCADFGNLPRFRLKFVRLVN